MTSLNTVYHCSYASNLLREIGKIVPASDMLNRTSAVLMTTEAVTCLL
jgi:hypothetical protein